MEAREIVRKRGVPELCLKEAMHGSLRIELMRMGGGATWGAAS